MTPVQPVFSVSCLGRLRFTFVLFNLFFTFFCKQLSELVPPPGETTAEVLSSLVS